jgi:hypothetical protein
MENIVINNIGTSYYITQDGKCFNSNTDKFLKGQIDQKNGYLYYTIVLPSGKKKRCYAHRLVAETFIEKIDKSKNRINHIDGNKLNNCVDNLEWAIQEESQSQVANHVFCFNKNKQLVAEYLTIDEAAAATQIRYSIILQELNKKVKTLSGNFYWSYFPELGETKEYKSTGKSKPVNQYDLKGKFITTYPSVGTAARALGLKNSAHIGECCRGKVKTYKGFVWRYVDDVFSPSGENQRDISQNIARKMESRWSGSTEDAFFSSEAFERNRILRQAEYEASGRSGKGTYYVLTLDVGRRGCDSVLMVLKVTPQSQGVSLKQLVNIYTMNDEHFEEQTIKIKRLFYKYKARRLVVDGNGIGIGLIDYLVKSQVDPDTNEIFNDFGIYNDADNFYKKFQTPNCEMNAVYIIKASAPINTEAHANLQEQISSGKLKLLIDERVAQNKLLGTKVGQSMKPEQRADYLKPYKLTSVLKEEMLNLRQTNEGVNIILKQVNRGIAKDKVSSLEYGLYYIKQEEDSKKKKKNRNFKEWKLFN